jgi:hypothetical protein
MSHIAIEGRGAEKQLWLAILFPVFTVGALGIDSVVFLNNYFDGRQLTNVLAVTYFLMLFYTSGSYLRTLMFIMVFLSYVGELLFCKVLGMYMYRTSAIPLYVPFGHAIVYASGYILAHTSFAVKNDRSFRIIFAVSFSVLFLSVGIFLNDIFSLVSGLLFFVLLRRKRWQNMYYFIALCVIFIELTGTYFKCWAWVPKIFGVIPAVNPPMGAVFYYAGGDVLLAKIVSVWKRKNK